MSKFLFHVKFSEKDNYVHEHELYEVMRSRNLYQVQFEVRSTFKKRMRNIQISEKAHEMGFHNTRNIFIHKMKERMEQAEKTRKITTRLAEKSFAKLFPKENKIVRRYPADFPNLIEKLATPVERLPEITPTTLSSARRSRRGTGTSRRSSSTFLSNAPDSPSMAATLYVDNSTAARFERARESKRNQAFNSSKVVVAGKTEPVTRYKENRDEENESFEEGNSSKIKPKSRGSSIDKMSIKMIDLDLTTTNESGVRDERKYSETNALPILSVTGEVPQRANFKPKRGSTAPLDSLVNEGETTKHDNHLTSLVHFPDHLTTTENLDSETASEKVLEWAAAHNMLNKSEKESEEEKTFRRLLIDRPSKWAFSHIHGTAMNDSSMFETQAFNPNPDHRKSKVVDFMPEKSKPKSTVSLPLIDSARRKPLVCMEPGALTPDGRLILTQGDYDDYLSGYRRARNMRLNVSKKRLKTLSKRVDKFNISPKQQLNDETRIFAVQSEC